MIRTLVGTAVAGLLLAGCNTPAQTASTSAAPAAGPQDQHCRKIVQDTGSKIMERTTVCDHGPGGDALRDSLRGSNQAGGIGK